MRDASRRLRKLSAYAAALALVVSAVLIQAQAPLGRVFAVQRHRGEPDLSPEGKRLGAIQMPRVAVEPRPRICATNVGFGDADAKGLYITGCSGLFHIRLNTPGILPGQK